MEADAFRWEHTHQWPWLAVVALLWLLFALYLAWRRRAARRLADARLWERLAPTAKPARKSLRLLCFSLAGLFAVVALVNPQYGTRTEKVAREGVDLFIALDLSRSMEAEDITPSRLERARLLVSRLIDKLRGDRVGLIVFAGNAYVQMPLTIDYAAAKLFLQSLNTDIVPTQGTALGEAIREALRSFPDDDQQYRSILLVSDGENHQGDALEAAAKATDEGARVFTVGVGSRDGSPIPDNQSKRQRYLRGPNGEVVVSRLNETMLQEIAGEGEGEYFRLHQAEVTAEAIVESLAGMEKRKIETQVYTDYQSYFQHALVLALFFMALGLIIPEKAGTSKSVHTYG
jgi:Ca-activated chloride channel family protein